MKLVIKEVEVESKDGLSNLNKVYTIYPEGYNTILHSDAGAGLDIYRIHEECGEDMCPDFIVSSVIGVTEHKFRKTVLKTLGIDKLNHITQGSFDITCFLDIVSAKKVLAKFGYK